MKLFFKFILCFIPIPFLIISINYFVDPANIFSEKYAKGIADYLVKGYNVTNVANFDERLLQKHFIEKMKKCPREIILGSSQSAQISSNYASETPFINNSVSGASLEDYLAIYHLYETKSCKIKKVLINLTPYLLNDNHDQVRWQSLEDEYFSFLTKNMNKGTKINYKRTHYGLLKNKTLLSPSYFKTSLKYLLNGKDKKYKPTKLRLNDEFTRLCDGTISYNKPYRSTTFEKVKNKAKGAILEKPIYSLGNFTNISEHYKNIFNSFIEYLQKQNIEVEFYLLPYHPIVYDYFKKNEYYHIVFKTECYFKEFATEHRIKVIGSFDPGKYCLDNSYFFDGFHCNEKGIKKILKMSN